MTFEWDVVLTPSMPSVVELAADFLKRSIQLQRDCFPVIVVVVPKPSIFGTNIVSSFDISVSGMCPLDEEPELRKDGLENDK